jgi:hypothetical protein
MADPAKEQEYRTEAAGYRRLPVPVQRSIVATLRLAARNVSLSEADRRTLLERADPLERLLRLD